MSTIGMGLLAGSTLVLSALMVMKAMLGVMPKLNLQSMIAGVEGSPDRPMLGWAVAARARLTQL